MTQNELVIERIFEAPVEKVWEAWTTAEKVKQWWAPDNFTAPEAKIDFRVGGRYLYAMRGKISPEAEERDYWSTGSYLEIVPMEKIVATDSFADSEGNIVQASYYGLGEGFPREMRVITTFEDIGDGKTKLALHHTGMPDHMLKNAQMGWEQSLNKMEKIL